MKIPLKNNPFTILDNFDRAMVRTNIVKPAWYAAVQLFPPGEIPLRTVNPLEHGNYLPPSHTVQLIKSQLMNAVSSKRRQKSKNFKQLLFSRPLKILYPEDSLRDRFYRQHPWELNRPIEIIETDESIAESRDWSTLSGGNKPTKVISGENVIQHTLYLVRNSDIKLDDAYEKVLAEFYQTRAREEIEVMKRREERVQELEDLYQKASNEYAKENAGQLHVMDTSSERLGKHQEDIKKISRPWTYRFNKLEEENLALSDEYQKEMRKKASERRVMQEKAKIYDQSNITKK
ncbi:mitochondrial ribosomal small subunit component, partial [Nowakowskiella sp. JEL0078]